VLSRGEDELQRTRLGPQSSSGIVVLVVPR